MVMCGVTVKSKSQNRKICNYQYTKPQRDVKPSLSKPTIMRGKKTRWTHIIPLKTAFFLFATSHDLQQGSIRQTSFFFSSFSSQSVKHLCTRGKWVQISFQLCKLFQQCKWTILFCCTSEKRITFNQSHQALAVARWFWLAIIKHVSHMYSLF